MESQNERIQKRLTELEIPCKIENHVEVFFQLQHEEFSNYELQLAIYKFERKISESRKNQVVF